MGVRSQYVRSIRSQYDVKGSPTRNTWVGEDNVRYFELDGDVLRLSLKDAQGHTTGTRTWRKIRSE